MNGSTKDWAQRELKGLECDKIQERMSVTTSVVAYALTTALQGS